MHLLRTVTLFKPSTGTLPQRLLALCSTSTVPEYVLLAARLEGTAHVPVVTRIGEQSRVQR